MYNNKKKVVDKVKAIVIGNSSYETYSEINNSLVEGMTIKQTETQENGGGAAGNISYMLAKWGIESYIASMLGSDDLANKIKKEYEMIGVKTDFNETSYDKGTSKTVIVVNKTNKLNTVIDIPNNAYLKKYGFNIEPDIVISDGYDYGASIHAFDKYNKSISILAVREVNNEIMELGKYVNYIILNKTASEVLANMQIDFNNSSTLVNVYNKIKQRYSKAEIIVTLGERGVMYAINGQVKVMPPIKMDLVCTYSAHSIFTGAFAYGIGRNFGLEKSLLYANIAASLRVNKLSARSGIPSLTEVSNYYDNKFGAQNNPNKSNNSNNPNNSNNETKPVDNLVNNNGVVNNNVVEPTNTENTVNMDMGNNAN